MCSRLGTAEEKMPARNSENGFRLVSCSSVGPIKCVDRIVQALAVLDDSLSVEWVHIGDGESFGQLQKMVRNLLSEKKNIRCKLLGWVAHQNVLQLYRDEPWDCFITTSSSEGGCPVSVQEAMAFGIPVIGTAVGGITELLVGSENIQLPPDPNPEIVAAAITKIYNMSPEERVNLCCENRQRWCEFCNADKNGRILAETIGTC